ncbi:hypothetical protein LTS18_007963, partial [Coniosporium uncinatum]
MPKAVRGVLVQCDASIKAIITKIDGELKNEIIIEDLDDETLLIKESQLATLKARLKIAIGDAVKTVEESGS